MKHLGIKKPPDYGQEVTQMFSQRNTTRPEYKQCCKPNLKLAKKFEIEDSANSNKN